MVIYYIFVLFLIYFSIEVLATTVVLIKVFFLFIKQTFHNNYEGCGIKFKTCVVFSCLFTDHSLHVRCSCSMYLPYVAIYCPQRCLIPPKKNPDFFFHTKNAAQTFHVYCQQVVNFSYLYCE